MMNAGQEKFLNFILERVKEDKAQEVKELLADNFKKQEEGKFTGDDAKQFIPKMISLLQPDKVEEVQAIMKQFAENIDHK
jgi:hypothetical protein